ncbi:hypothetical protein HK105_200320 [Polyrhizophydium stewartii]|uniref:DUF3533 domain-containing protein n=1 Tax=Polyrhizophydium stewartii TaxID=2732419 RepID=A0ABR4NLA6_9FUNG|nr:hypothetical protein HK105_001163 [Polyrhizophydium stewartii]
MTDTIVAQPDPDIVVVDDDAGPVTLADAVVAEETGADARPASPIEVLAASKRGNWILNNIIIASVFDKPSAFFVVIGTSLVVALYFMAYLGVVWDPQAHLTGLSVGFVNADAGFNFSAYPPTFAQAVLQQTGGKTMGQIVEGSLLGPSSTAAGLFSWQNLTGVPHDDLVNRVNNNELWNVVYIPANFSDSFLLNFNFGKPQTTVTYMNVENIYDQARQMTVASMANAVLAAVFKSLSDGFARKMLGSVNTNPAGNVTLSQPNIQLVANNLHPVLNFGRNMATYIICVVLWLSGLVTASVLTTIYTVRLPLLKQQDAVPHLRTPTRIILSAQITSIATSFLHALMSWGIYCAFIGSATSGFHPDYNSFVVLLYLWFVAASFHAVATTFCILIGKDYFSLPFSMLLILQLATSSSILDPDVMIGFGKITYAFPFYYANRSLKCMMLGSSCKFVPLNTGVIAAWWAAMLVVTFVAGRRFIVKQAELISRAAKMH